MQSSGQSGNVHISESLSRILNSSPHPTASNSGLAMLQRAVTVQQQNQALQEQDSITGNSKKFAPVTKLFKPTTVSPKMVVTTSPPATGSTSNLPPAPQQQQQQASRLTLPIIHGQNGQLLMLMNQTDLVRLAQESAISQMLTMAQQQQQQHQQQNSSDTASQQSSNSILANVVAPISPINVDGDGEDGSNQGVLIEGGHHSGSGTTGGTSDRAMRRKSVHNEVEKRRRQKINMWIEKLSAIIPPAPTSSTETPTQNTSSSSSNNTNNLSCKADVLQRTYDYVIQISKAHNDLARVLTLVQQENEVLRQEVARLTGPGSANLVAQKEKSQSPEPKLITSSPTGKITAPRLGARSASPDRDDEHDGEDDADLVATKPQPLRMSVDEGSASPKSSDGSYSGSVKRTAITLVKATLRSSSPTESLSSKVAIVMPVVNKPSSPPAAASLQPVQLQRKRRLNDEGNSEGNE